ncbi:glycosyltransferase family 87 protein [Pelagibius sp. CAU 1746]|uniref:glycosyltransferase family 87 protein n=1 Tax=Pelagibius sp. CAU 1746 TaxID=3140370 RepID=UPI00325B80BE
MVEALGSPAAARNDKLLCAFLLLVSLAYSGFAAFDYFSYFEEGLFDFTLRPVGRDFVNYWTAGSAVLDGLVPQVFDVSFYHAYQERLFDHEVTDYNWSYPPHMLLLVWPLGALSYLWALAAWSLVLLLLYLWAAASGRQQAALVAVALLAAPATFECLTSGQNGFLTGALLIGGLRLLGPRPVLAGILFGILTIKPQLGLLLPFALLAARQWTAIAAAGLTTLVLVGISIAVFGWGAWEAYFELVVPTQSEILTERTAPYLKMMPSAYIGMRLIDAEPLLRNAAQILMSGVALAGVVWVFRRSTDADLKFAVIAVGAFLASPYAFDYDMTAVMLAVVLVTLRGLRDGFLPGERIALAATWSLPSTVFWLNAVHLPVGALILLSCFVCLLARNARAVKGESRRGFVWAKSSQRLAS